MNPAQAAHIIRTTGARFSSRTPAGGGRAGNAALPPSERPRSQRPIEEKDFRRTQQEIDDAGTIVELSYAITRLLKSADGQAADIVSYSAATFLKRVGTTTINLVGANVAAYASLCNQWSKLGVDAPSREACARVARAVSDAEQPTVAVIEPWHVALFVGAFSRFSDGKDEKKAAVKLADAF
jgi:hypothetical protein